MIRSQVLVAALATIVAFGSVAGCLQSETETGPTVGITLSTDSGTASDTDDMAELDLSGEAAYSVQIVINTQAGESDDGDATFPVTTFTGTLSIPVTTFTESAFTSDGNDEGPQFTSTSKIAIPASNVGKTLAVTLDAQDSRGLKSNAISFQVKLVDSGP